MTSRLAIYLMVLQAALFAAETAIIHQLGSSVPIAMLVGIRGLGGLMLALLFARSFSVVRTEQLGLQIGRGFVALSYAVVLVYSYSHLPFSDATAISYTASLYITLFSALLLRETVGPWRWFAVAIAFSGALLIARPGLGGSFTIAYLVVFAGTSLNGLQFCLNKLLNRTDPQTTTLFYLNLISVLGTLPVIATDFAVPPPESWGWLAAFLIVGPLGTYVGIVALQYAEASELAPYTLVRLVIAMLIAVSLFGERPDIYSTIGAAAIIAGCVLSMRRPAHGETSAFVAGMTARFIKRTS